MADVKILTQVLLDYAISQDRTHAVSYEEQAERIVADPQPLLLALADASILNERTTTFYGYHCGHRETWLETPRDRVEWSDNQGHNDKEMA